MKKRILSLFLTAAMFVAMTPAISAPVSAEEPSATPSHTGQVALSPFAQNLESKYVDPDRVFSTDVRWWLSAALTTETLMEEIQALYDGGFRGVELCMQSDGDASVYGYGGAEWAFKWKLMMNKLLDLGMGVYLTSGTHWSTSNVPGLNPDSQDAMQVVAQGALHTVAAGATLNTTLNPPATFRTRSTFIGAYAYRQTTNNVADYNSIIDLSAFVTGGPVPGGINDTGDARNRQINWTAPADPADGSWRVYGLWMQGSYQSSSPAVQTSYATNYFDVRGVQALRTYWEANYLNEPALNQKILDGNVHVFMDSIEANPSGGVTFWAEDMAQEFVNRKGYDIRPYIFLLAGISGGSFWSNTYTPMPGTVRLAGDNEILRQRIVSDYLDVQTQVYNERMLGPLTSWLNSVGIQSRAQYSYGKAFEMSEPGMYLDLIDTENRVKYNQADYFRNWSGAAKLQNKLFSTESSAQSNTYTRFSRQMHLRDAYAQYASGVQNMIWHVWGAEFASGASVAWPGGLAGMAGFYRFSTRDPLARDHDEFNAHLGRVQQLMQTGKARSDIGFISNKWVMYLTDSGEGTATPTTPANINRMNWQLAHQGIFYRSTELQDNGYTYDYFSPKFLFNDDVSFNEETKTIELAGYKALVLYQEWLDLMGAEKILDWAKKGLPVVILGDAASRTPFNDGKDAQLAAVMTQLKALPTVRVATVDNYADYFTATAVGYEDNVMEMLQELGVYPYAEFVEPNHQLLTQTRVDGDGNMYLYAYNYCPNTYHRFSHIDSVKTMDHGTNIKTEIIMDGLYVPYEIDAWSGKLTELANYRYENGKTVFPIDLDYDNVALFAFEAVDKAKLHIVTTDAQSAYATQNGMVVRATASGNYKTTLSSGSTFSHTATVPAPYDITGWDLTVESRTPGTAGAIQRTESRFDNSGGTTTNSKASTVITNISVSLNRMTTWDNIPEIGRNVSGLGRYEATFSWNADAADGAYLDFGDTFIETMKVWVNGHKVGGDVSANPTKVKRSVGVAIDGVIPTGMDLYSGGVSWTKPVADISAYLVDGVNEIVIEYSSSLTNVQLSRGAIAPQTGINGVYNWHGYNVDYRAYGPSRAVVVPFVDTQVEYANAGVSGPEGIAFLEDSAEYLVWLNAYTFRVNAVEATFTVNNNLDYDSIGAEILDALADHGFKQIGALEWKTVANGMQGRLTLGIEADTVDLVGLNDILQLTFDVLRAGGKGAEEEIIITLDRLSLVTHPAGATPVRIDAAISPEDGIRKAFVYSRYDLNKDGSVDVVDLGIALLAIGWADDQVGWDTFPVSFDANSKAITPAMINVNTVAVDGLQVINMLDVLDILMNYTGW